MSKCPRFLAIDLLCQWQQGGQPMDALLLPALQELADTRDRNLLKAMIFGSLRERGALDWALSRLASSPLPSLKPIILAALRVGAYQLLFLERVPHSAAIHTTVEAVKQLRQPRWLAGFVNGVLRNLARRRQEFLAAIQAGKAPAEALHNHPAWLLARWQTRYGLPGMAAICQSNSQPARLCLRVNSARISVDDYVALLAAQQIGVARGVYAAEAIWLEESGGIADLPGFSEGYFFVQDEIAQLIAGLILPFPAGNCLDGCAGLGGKTAVLAGLLPAGTSIVAVEPHPPRQRLFQENMARLGLDRVELFPGTLAEYGGRAAGGFGAVLIDAPCSGLGVTGRHPDIRWQRHPADLPKFQAKQLAILAEAAPLVVPGGVLVYATCSTEPEENEAVVAQFREQFPQFVVDNAAGSLPPAARPLVDGHGFLRTVPGHQASDGFFAARFRRQG